MTISKSAPNLRAFEQRLIDAAKQAVDEYTESLSRVVKLAIADYTELLDSGAQPVPDGEEVSYRDKHWWFNKVDDPATVEALRKYFHRKPAQVRLVDLRKWLSVAVALTVADEEQLPCGHNRTEPRWHRELDKALTAGQFVASFPLRKVGVARYDITPRATQP